MAILERKNLSSIRKKHKDKKIVYCDGAFDLPHVGHILFFEDCKRHGDILVVGLGSDALIRKNKGKERPILNEKIRLKTVDSFKPVDYCFLIKDKINKDHKLAPLIKTFKSLEPDVAIFNKDAFDIPYRQKVAKAYGVKLVILPRYCPKDFEGISTSKIIAKIKNSR